VGAFIGFLIFCGLIAWGLSNFLSVAAGPIFLYVFIGLMIVIFIIMLIVASNEKAATRSIRKEREHDQTTFSTYEAERLAENWSRKTDISEESHALYRKQGAEMYRYLREKGYSHSTANERIEHEYARSYDRARRKAIRDIPKQAPNKRRS
jgi:hypothetical protein